MNAPAPLPIEDYGLIGDCTTAALVGRNGSIDWLCWPRFDSAALFAALLGDERHGRWLLAPADAAAIATRAYHDGTLVLETVFETAEGSVAVIDFMPVGRPHSAVARVVQGRRGRVAMRMELALRFDYGLSVPWVVRTAEADGVVAIAGPDMAVLRSPVELRGEDLTTVAEFTVAAGETLPFTLSHTASHLPPPPAFDAPAALRETEAHWREWSNRCAPVGRWTEAVRRSLLTLKALTFAPTGGMVAAATTSLPEQLGGSRNWDYRFCWLRDATVTLYALLHAGYVEEASAWRTWLHRSLAGSPDQVQIMYGLAGERRLPEWEVPWLPGYGGAAPVRIGNGAAGQLQLDVFGEVMDAMHYARVAGLPDTDNSWSVQCAMLSRLESVWEEPDEGIWEVRGGRRHFTFSKVMAWVAFDRAVRDAEAYGLTAPLDRWRALRDRIHETTCRQGFDAKRGSFVQSFGADALDASLLLIPLVGFLPHDDPRVRATTAAIERELVEDGLVLRYRTEEVADGLPAGEGAFLACSFWLADNLAGQGRGSEAAALFERLLALRNDVGLLAEEYDPRARRFTGNFPQAFSHVGLVGTALTLAGAAPPRGPQDAA